MLTKLIKYDLKYGVKIFVLLQVMQLAAAVIGRVFFLERMNFHAPSASFLPALILFYATFLLIFSAVSLGTMLLIAVRFYKNLFTDEGYLTWTIPATPIQHLWSKLLSGSIWYCLSQILSMLSFIIMISGKNMRNIYEEIASDVTEILGMPLPSFIRLVFVMSILGVITSVIMIYFCIVIGQLFPAHRILGALITYFIIYIVTSLITNGCMILFGIFPGTNFDFNHPGAATYYIYTSLKITTGINFATAISEYFVIRWVMTKKINLL